LKPVEKASQQERARDSQTICEKLDKSEEQIVATSVRGEQTTVKLGAAIVIQAARAKIQFYFEAAGGILNVQTAGQSGHVLQLKN
jgi:hypothetical protein